MELTTTEFTVLARCDVLTYEQVARLLGVTRREAQDIVIDLELAGYVRLALPARRVGLHVAAPAMFTWVGE